MPCAGFARGPVAGAARALPCGAGSGEAGQPLTPGRVPAGLRGGGGRYRGSPLPG